MAFATYDAAGKDYRCSQVAALVLKDRIGEAPISCEPRDTGRYARTVAVCRKGDEELNAWLVSSGQAIAYRRYSTDYMTAETAAKATKRGMWSEMFQEPTDYRKAKRAGGADPRPAAVAAGSCAIKGNISAKGDKIYQTPGTCDYERTRINEKSGERMFCSEEEAKAAGWRAPRG